MKSINKNTYAYSVYGFYIKIAAAVLAVVLCAAQLPAEILAAEPDTVYASQALLGDLDSGRVLFAQNADEQVVPASTTKVITAMLVIEAIERGELDPDERVTAKQSIIDGVVFDASRVLPYIEDGESLTVREYLYCIMLSSDCVACDILAERVSGSVESFVKLMNERAAELGCTNTNFVNTHGYPTEGHYTSANSLFRIMRQAMRYDLFREIIATIKTEIPETNKNPARKLYNSNWMIWDPEKITSMYTVYYYPYSIGGKTGSSKISGHCLVSCAQKDGVTLIAVVTGASNEVAEETGSWTNRSFSESKKLFEWGFESYSMRTVVTSGSDAGRFPVSGGDAADVGLRTSGDLEMLAPNDMQDIDTERRNVFYSAAVDAPVSAGDVIGRMEVYYRGDLCGSVELEASEDVRLAPPKPPEKKNKSRLPLIMILVTLVLFAGAFVLYVTNNRKILIQDLYAKSKNGSSGNGRASYNGGTAKKAGQGQKQTAARKASSAYGADRQRNGANARPVQQGQRKQSRRPAQQGARQQGAAQQGARQQGATQQGARQQGAARQDMIQQGAAQQGARQQGAAQQGARQQGAGQQGARQQGAAQQGAGQQGNQRPAQQNRRPGGSDKSAASYGARLGQNGERDRTRWG